MPNTHSLAGNSADALPNTASAPELGSLYELFPNLAPPAGTARHEVEAWLPAPADRTEAAVERAAV